jgi:hypothetical protein
MARMLRQTELRSRHKRLEESQIVRRLCQTPGRNWRFTETPCNHCVSQDHGSAQYFHGIATDADVGNAFPFPRCPDVDLTGAAALDALLNHHLLITVCDAVPNHPTGSAACRRSGGWVFAAIKKHSSSSFEPAFAAFGTKKVE